MPVWSTYLHPTMYLLIPVAAVGGAIATGFTSHYVSINSISAWMIMYKHHIFTSHYVSINSVLELQRSCPFRNLHPTMYLLIQ